MKKSSITVEEILDALRAAESRSEDGVTLAELRAALPYGEAALRARLKQAVLAGVLIPGRRLATPVTRPGYKTYVTVYRRAEKQG